MKHKSGTPAGFTLVEIMIVVAIIGMLATIAIPNYIQARKTAYQKTCLNNLHQIDGAVQEWALEMRKNTDETVTYEDIRNYLKNSVVCPSGGTSFADSYTLTTVEARPLCQRQAETHKLPL